MIQITRINRHTLVLNSDLIEQIESTPDTVIHLVNGQKVMVLESAEEIVRRVVEFRRSLLHDAPRASMSTPEAAPRASVSTPEAAPRAVEAAPPAAVPTPEKDRA